MPPLRGQIHFVMSSRDVERLRQFPWPRAKTFLILNSAPFFHQLDAANRFQRPDQNKTIRLAFYEHVQHPVRTITEINASCSGLVSLDEAPRARARKRMTSFVVLRRIRFRLHDNPCAFLPDQFRADELARTGNRIALEKKRANDLLSHL